MLIFEIITPGTSLDYSDINWKFKIESQINSLKSAFFKANIALILFIQSATAQPRTINAITREQYLKRIEEIRETLARERGRSLNNDEISKNNFDAEVIFKRERWKSGEAPEIFTYNLEFIHAQTFLYALDSFDKFLKVLSEEADVPLEVAEFYNEFQMAFPDLRGVRNSIQHMEDRIRGLGVKGKPLDLKPIPKYPLLQGRIQIYDNLDGSKYGSTKADGSFGEVDVSPQSMQHLQGILMNVLNSFKWKGPKRHEPK